MRLETPELPYVMMVLGADGRYLELTIDEGQYRDELVLSLYAGGVEHSELEANLNPADVAELVELLTLAGRHVRVRSGSALSVDRSMEYTR